MEKKIKIIDILCCISTGDYDMLPKKIKYEEIEWNLDTNNYCKADYTDGNQYMIADYIDKHFIIQEILNDEVEILDEEDEFEDIESFGISYSLDYIDYRDIEVLKEYLNKDFQNIFNTLDLLIKNQKKIIERLNNLNND